MMMHTEQEQSLERAKLYSELTKITSIEFFDNTFKELPLAKALEQAEALLKADFSVQALLQAWIALEIVLRQIAQNFEPELERRSLSTPEYIVNLTSLGYLTQAEYDVLWPIMRTRNGFIHGYEAEGNIKEMAEKVIAIVQKVASQSFD
jgi:hypothetical protein